MKRPPNVNHLINKILPFIQTCIFILIHRAGKDSLYICDIPNAKHLKARID